MALYQTLKVSLRDDIRRFKLRPEHTDINALRTYIDSLFGQNLVGMTWRILWQDEEDDLITIATNDDLELLLESALQDESRILRVFIDVEKKDSVRNVLQELAEDPAVADLLQSLVGAGPFSMPRCKRSPRFRWYVSRCMNPSRYRASTDPKVRCPSGEDPNKKGGEVERDVPTDMAKNTEKDVSHNADDRAAEEELGRVIRQQESSVHDPPSDNDAPAGIPWARELQLLREMGINFVDESTLIASLNKHRGLMSAVLSEIFRGR